MATELAKAILRALSGAKSNPAPIEKAVANTLINDPSMRDIGAIAADLAHDSAARMLQDVSDTKKRTVARIVARGVEYGWTEQAVADQIERVVGLHSKYADAVERYRVSLVGNGVTKMRARQLSRQYADRLRAQRALTIARTEMQRVQNDAQRILWQKKKEGGEIGSVVRVVKTRPQCCSECRKHRGKRRSVKHTTGGPPFHPNCHCWEELHYQQAPMPVAPFRQVIKDRRPAPFVQDAKDGDGDGLVQDGTVHERPATAVPDAPETKAQTTVDEDDLINFADAYEGISASDMQAKAARKISGGAINNFVVMVEHDGKQFLVKQPGMGREYRNEEVGGAVANAFGLSYAAVIINPDAVDHGGEYGEGPEDYFDDDEVEGDPMIVFPFIDGDVGYEAMEKIKAKHPARHFSDSDDFMKIAVMDLILQNRDRHSGNWMMRKDGRIIPIDHGFLNFSESDDLLENEYPHLEMPDTEGQEDDRAELLDRLIEWVTGAYNSPNKWWLNDAEGIEMLAMYEDELKDMYEKVRNLYELDSYERDIILFRFDLLLERLGIEW